MKLIAPPTVDPDEVYPGLAGYQATMTGHCPHLGPSIARNLTTWCGYEASPADAPHLLALLVETAEKIRTLRRRHGPLVCANIAIFGPPDIPSAQAVLDWPHWITRNLYAPVQLMVGKFWIGEQECDRHAQAIAPPPISFLSLRHSMQTKDSRFLSDLPGVAARLAAAGDTGQDVLMPVLGVPLTPDAVRRRYTDLIAKFPSEQKKGRT